MICITIQRTLSVAKVRYLIGDKECFKIFYPRFFAWINLFFIKPYSSLFFAISISIHSNLCGKGSCFLNVLFGLHVLILSPLLSREEYAQRLCRGIGQKDPLYRKWQPAYREISQRVERSAHGNQSCMVCKLGQAIAAFAETQHQSHQPAHGRMLFINLKTGALSTKVVLCTENFF